MQQQRGVHFAERRRRHPPEWTLGAGVAKGLVTAKASFASAGYSQHFPYWVYTSANYAPNMPAIFLLFGDGNQSLADFHAAAAAPARTLRVSLLTSTNDLSDQRGMCT